MNARLELVDHPKIVVVANHMCVDLGDVAFDAGWPEVAQLEFRQLNSSQIEGQGDVEEGHCGGHRQPGLQQSVTNLPHLEAGDEAAAERENVAVGVQYAAVG